MTARCVRSSWFGSNTFVDILCMAIGFFPYRRRRAVLCLLGDVTAGSLIDLFLWLVYCVHF